MYVRVSAYSSTYIRMSYNGGKLQDTDVSVEETDCKSGAHVLGGMDSLQSDSNRYENTGGYYSHALLLGLLSTSYTNTLKADREVGLSEAGSLQP